VRATKVLITVGAALRFASADVVCNTEALHYAAQVIADTTNEDFGKSVENLCDRPSVKDFAEVGWRVGWVRVRVRVGVRVGYQMGSHTNYYKNPLST
jgi:hypothetical protein